MAQARQINRADLFLQAIEEMERQTEMNARPNFHFQSEPMDLFIENLNALRAENRKVPYEESIAAAVKQTQQSLWEQRFDFERKAAAMKHAEQYGLKPGENVKDHAFNLPPRLATENALPNIKAEANQDFEQWARRVIVSYTHPKYEVEQSSKFQQFKDDLRLFRDNFWEVRQLHPELSYWKSMTTAIELTRHDVSLKASRDLFLVERIRDEVRQQLRAEMQREQPQTQQVKAEVSAEPTTTKTADQTVTVDNAERYRDMIDTVKQNLQAIREWNPGMSDKQAMKEAFEFAKQGINVQQSQQQEMGMSV